MENKTNNKQNIPHLIGGIFIIGTSIFLLLTPLGDEGITKLILQLLFVTGCLIYTAPKFGKKLQSIYSKFTVILILGFFSVFNLQAQDTSYDKQLNAFKQSFTEKSAGPIKPYISSKLSFYTYPAGATTQILTQVFKNLPTLKSADITKSEHGEITVIYDFDILGKRESKIMFDKNGLITGIQLIDLLLEEQHKAQKVLQNSVKEPDPSVLGSKYPPTKVTFPSIDGLTVTGNLYEINPEAPVILLCHQANFNKYEYADIAPKLNKMGYNALAIDQRSGGSLAGIDNETHKRVILSGKTNISFIDAEPDIRAAVDYLVDKYKKDITIWGSSYSSSLSILLANENSHINSVIAFSPGNYFGNTKPLLQEVLKDFDKPFLLTSSKDESRELMKMLEGIELKEMQFHFIPETEGFHGSRALWEGQNGADEYWDKVKQFLSIVYMN